MTENNRDTYKDLFARNFRAQAERFTHLAEDLSFLENASAASILIGESLRKGNTVYACGNGGSMADAVHFCEELTGRFRENRPGLRAVAISDASYLTCVLNDFGPDEVFSRFVDSMAREGDVLVALSTSGRSQNVIRAAETMRVLGGRVVSFVGASSTPLSEISDVSIAVGPSEWADRIQESHIVALHSIVESVERILGLTGSSMSETVA